MEADVSGARLPDGSFQPSAGSPRTTLAFDLFGTLVDPIAISTELARRVPEQAVRIAEVWRQKQLEYSFRLAVMEQYQDFEQVTRMALEYALAFTGTSLADDEKAALLASYDDLACFPDAAAGLASLQAAGCRMVVFSNGSPRMIAAALQWSGLERYGEGFVSVDEVRAYKPSPGRWRQAPARASARRIAPGATSWAPSRLTLASI